MSFSILLQGQTNSGFLHPEIDECIKITELNGFDSLFVNPVYFCTAEEGNSYYYSKLRTSVCQDELCRIVYLKVYWDLAGNYLEFDTIAGYGLTKNDHIPFNYLDYVKLHNTLRNDNSILGEKTKEELLDKAGNRYSDKIDGYTGATAKEIKSSVVEGAVYSTYALWNLINGEIRIRLREHTYSIMDKNIQKQLLSSNNPKTLLAGVKTLDMEDYSERFDLIVSILLKGHSLVNFYIAKKLPSNVINLERNREVIEGIIEQMDSNTRSVLMSKL